jgi:Domain of Unknown Function with PDB structure (DUF3858)/Transglutaminase-like superfamily
MKIKKRILLVFFGILFLHVLQAQDKADYKFGKITAADFNLSADKFDSGANALIIADIGTAKFEGNNKGYFNLIFTRFMRVKIINKNGFDIGSQEISLLHNHDGDYEKLYSLRASTFILENGVISETKLDDKSVFTQKYNSNIDDKKFTVPALKEGAIFDIEYTVKSPFDFRLMPWSFQGEYPRLWSEYVVTIPPPLHYVMRLQGNDHFDINESKDANIVYIVRESNGTSSDDSYTVDGPSVYKRWVKKNVPAIHEEPFTTTIDNYYSKMTFQLQYIQWSNESPRHEQNSTWTARSKTLLEDADFGQALGNDNNWMNDVLKEILQGSNTEDDKTYKIYCYIRDNFRAVEKAGYNKNALYTRNSLKDVFKKKEGNVAEINLLLIAMLRKAEIKADPVILSTRDNGIADPSYPLLDEYNYVICEAHPGDKWITLDASEPYNGYGLLPVSCYNGWGHVINEELPVPIYLTADSMREANVTNVIIINDEKGKPSGGYSCVLGKSESFGARKEIIASSLKEYEKKLQTQYGSDINLENFGVDSLKKYDFPLTIHYDFDLKSLSSGDILYFNPMLDDGYKTNPFKSMNRLYPVEMPFKIDEIYLLTMDIPTGYQIDELPKSVRVAYNENEGMFEYLIQKGQNNLQMRVHLKLDKAFFPVDEYSTLRDFFAYVVKKENEQIVFKKTH